MSQWRTGCNGVGVRRQSQGRVGGLGALLLGLVILATRPVTGLETEDDAWALEIFDKVYDEPAGELRVVVRNGGSVEVTAYALAMVFDDSGGGRGGDMQVNSIEMLPGDGIAPGEFHETRIAIGDGPAPPSHLAARKVSLHYEILSDTSSHGYQPHIEQVFASRAAVVAELEAFLPRFRAQRRMSGSTSLVPLLRAEAARGKEADSLSLEQQSRLSRAQLDGLEAISNIGDLAEQFADAIEKGRLAPLSAVVEFEAGLQRELDRAAGNIRSIDRGRRLDR